MKMKIYAMRDNVTENFSSPMFLVNTGHAIRGFSDEINNPENKQLNQHSEDYDLYELGAFDTENGVFETHEPKKIAVGKDHKRG